ncbi:hypothetical protein HPB47_022508 [Ixodes persulcatus]|uniref:Uncharacterized protein n=1 Tax=Ixodes persulcatus TaxID=34615 RepID=A0AC60QCR3_IXOPE|nr:hypothetical protein HPB47_022508 [Ixodes persulcatus]
MTARTADSRGPRRLAGDLRDPNEAWDVGPVTDAGLAEPRSGGTPPGVNVKATDITCFPATTAPRKRLYSVDVRPHVFDCFVSQTGTIPEEVSDRRTYAGGARSGDDKCSGFGPFRWRLVGWAAPPWFAATPPSEYVFAVFRLDQWFSAMDVSGTPCGPLAVMGDPFQRGRGGGGGTKHYASRRLTTSLNLMDKVPSQGEGKPNQIVCDADAAQKIQEMDCGQSSDETLQGRTRKRKTNADLATNLAENEDNGQLTTVSEKHLQLRSILATLLADESQENLITKILGLLTEITAKKKTSRKRSKTLKETETAKDSPTSNAKPSATHTQESRSKSISAPLQQENEATPPGEQQPLRQPQPSGKDTTKGGQDENAADNDDDGFIKVTNKRKRHRREPQPDTQKPNEHLKEVRIRPKSKTPMGEWKLEILGYLEKTLEIKLPVVAARRMGNTKTVAITFEGEKLPRSILFNRYHAPLCGRTHPREGMDTDTSESECPDPKTYCQLCKKEGHLATDKNCATRRENNRKMRASIQAMKAQARSSQVGARIETVPDPSSNPTAAPATPTVTPQTTVPAKSPSPTSLASSYANMIKVVQWNCRGLRLRAAELNARFHARPQDRPDVLLMQETNTTLTCVGGYAVYSTPTITDKKGGAPGKSSIFISHACPHHQIDLSRWCNDEQEVVAHVAWGYRKSSKTGKELYEEMTQHGMTLMNKEGVKTRTGLGPKSQDTSPDLTDHLPIFVEMSLTKKRKDVNNKRVTRTVNWDEYRKALTSLGKDDTPFEKRLTDDLKIATIIKEVDEDIPVPDLYLLKLWAKRLQALQAYRKGPKTVYGRRKVTRITIEARYYAKRLERQRWLDYSASLSEKTSITALWATCRAMMGKKKN